MAKIIRWRKPASETLDAKASQVRSWPVATFATDAQGQFVFVNSHWTQLTGLPLSTALGAGWAASVHDDDRQEVIQHWDEAVHGEKSFACSYRLNAMVAEFQWVLSQALPQYDDDGELTGYCGTLVRTLQFSQIESGN